MYLKRKRSIRPREFERSNINRIINASKIIRIGRWAFRWSQITYIDIRNSSVLTIQQGTFKGCTNLVHFLGNVISVKDNAFDSCHNLESFQTQDLKFIGYSAFKDCWRLSQFCDVHFDVVRIPDSAFENCKSLSYLKVFAKTMGVKAFYNCFSLSLFINTDKPIFFEAESVFCVDNVICSSKISGDKPKNHTLHLLFEDNQPFPLPKNVYFASGTFSSE